PVGAEGLPFEHGQHLAIADEPRCFARQVIRLLRDVDRRRSLGSAARALVVDRYDWSVVAGALESALLSIVDRRLRRTNSTRIGEESSILNKSAISNQQSAM